MYVNFSAINRISLSQETAQKQGSWPNTQPIMQIVLFELVSICFTLPPGKNTRPSQQTAHDACLTPNQLQLHVQLKLRGKGVEVYLCFKVK